MTRRSLPAVVSLLLLVAAPSQAPAFLKRGAKPSPPPPTPSESTPSLHIGSFSGSSGDSARKALTSELERSRVLTLVESAATPSPSPVFSISAESVGGRVSAQLRDSSGRTQFERTYAAPGLDENIQSLADDLIYTLTGKPGLATSRIVFVSNHSGTHQIYLCNADGENIQQVTRHRHGAVSPSLSPDASLLAFTSYRSGFPEVVLMDLGGGMERVVTDTPGNNFGASFAPDGRHLAMVMSFLGNPEIFVTDLGTNAAGCLTESVGVPASPDWSPVGTRLAYASDEGNGSQLFILDFGSEKSSPELTRLGVGFRFVTDPAWAPDGSAIAFTARSRNTYVVAVKAYPEGPVRVIQRGAQHPSWSPNGRYLIYVQNGDLYRHDMTTGARRLLVGGFGQISEPRWMN